MTALSGAGPGGARRPVARALARRSLYLAVMSTALAGCVDPPPEYQTPQRIPPLIDWTVTKPSDTGVILFDRDSNVTDELPFQVYFHADDAQDRLSGIFDVDDPQGTCSGVKTRQSILPDPRPFFDQTNRHFNWNWPVSGDDVGCHTMTLILTYDSNLARDEDAGTASNCRTIDPALVARVTWIIDIKDPASTPGWHDIQDCPKGPR